MNIVLVDVSADTNFISIGYTPHPGLAYMAACLEEAGYSVRIVDPVSSDNNFPEILRQIIGFKPHIVGFTATTAARFQTIAVINGVKEATNAFVVCGGPHFNPTAQDAMSKVPAIDCIVKGEGEKTIVEIAQAVEVGGSFSNIRGVFYRENGGVVETPDRPVNTELDSLPRPAYHLFDLKRYRLYVPDGRKVLAMGVASSRGCPCRCIFCSITALQKHNFRKRSPELFLDEVAYLQKTYGYRGFLFNDDTLTMDRNHVVSVCNGIIKRKMNIQWSALARVNTIDRDLLSLMKSAGCCFLMYGVESGSDITLKTIKKGITIEQATKAVEMTADVGIPFSTLFMVSFPGETMEELRKTINLMDKFSAYPNARAPYGFTCIYPGTELETLAYKEGILPPDFSWNTDYEKSFYNVLGTDPVVPCWETPALPLRDLKAIIFKSRPLSVKLQQIIHKFFGLRGRDLFSAVRIFCRTFTINKKNTYGENKTTKTN